MVTNNHVILDGQGEVQVYWDEERFDATVVGRDATTDVALLKIDVDRELPYLPEDLVTLVNEQTLAVIIRRNTGIGAELQDAVFVANMPCMGDIDADGQVGLGDLIALLANWGPCPGGCMADIDDTMVVDVSDLVKLLSAWGPCP